MDPIGVQMSDFASLRMTVDGEVACFCFLIPAFCFISSPRLVVRFAGIDSDQIEGRLYLDD